MPRAFSCPIAGLRAPQFFACVRFMDDFEACIAHLRFPVTHRRAIRTTNLLERLFTLEARMITIPGSLALEHVDEPQADGDTDAEQDGDGCADDEAAGNTNGS